MSDRVDQVVRNATILLDQARCEEASELVRIALKDLPDSHQLIFQLALIEARQANWSLAEDLARSARRIGGDAYASGLGQILANAEKYGEAEVELKRAFAFDPRDANALACLGSVYGNQRRFVEGLACLETALSIQPDHAWAQYCKEQMLKEQRFLELVESSLNDFSRKVGIDPDGLSSAIIEIPAKSLAANGASRFKMALPAKLILSDIGAAHLFYEEIEKGGYEPLLRGFLDALLLPDDVFIDVGAHWGIHSLTAGTRWPGQVNVLAIEAHPDNSARLQDWVDINVLDDVIETIPKALGQQGGLAKLRVNGSSMGHSLRDSNDVGLRQIEIEMTTLDELLAPRSHLRWRRTILKLDVEGYELEVLTGARTLLESGHVAAVIWENSDFYGEIASRNRCEAISNLLASHGFQHFSFQGQGDERRLAPVRPSDGTHDIFSLSSKLFGT